MKLNEILEVLQGIAPREMAEEWDNVGLLVSREGDEIDKILVCLDYTKEALEQAIREGCQMIVTHHPVIFKPLARIADPLLMDAVKHNICIYSCHTNLDAAPGGVNDVLARKLDLYDVHCDGMLRFGALKEALGPEAFFEHVKLALNVPMLRACPVEDKKIQRVAVLGGAGGDFLHAAIENKCDAFVTGEASYHVAQAAQSAGVVLVCAGHFETEVPVVQALSKVLSESLPLVRISEGITLNPFPVL